MDGAETPYTVVLADMSEGFRVMTRLSSGAAGDLAVGQAVTLLVEHAADGRPELRFQRQA